MENVEPAPRVKLELNLSVLPEARAKVPVEEPPASREKMPPRTSTVPALVRGRLKGSVPERVDLRRVAPLWLSKDHAPVTLKTRSFLKSQRPPLRLEREPPAPLRMR